MERNSHGDAVQGRRLTSYSSLWSDLCRAGAEVIDQEVVIDGQLTTSRSPADLLAFCAAMVEQLPRRANRRAAEYLDGESAMSR